MCSVCVCVRLSIVASRYVLIEFRVPVCVCVCVVYGRMAGYIGELLKQRATATNVHESNDGTPRMDMHNGRNKQRINDDGE